MNKQYQTRILLSESTRTACSGGEFVAIGETEVRGREGRIMVYTVALFVAVLDYGLAKALAAAAGLDPATAAGIMAGALTSTPALGVVQEAAKSPIPALGYAGTYAFANILLTMAGAAIVLT